LGQVTGLYGFSMTPVSQLHAQGETQALFIFQSYF
jgi:hypothetical protein